MPTHKQMENYNTFQMLSTNIYNCDLQSVA